MAANPNSIDTLITEIEALDSKALDTLIEDNPEIICPISGEIMRDPVSVATGHTFNREGIAQWLSNHNTNPVTGEILQHKELAPNWSLKSMITRKLEGLKKALSQQNNRSQSSSSSSSSSSYGATVARFEKPKTSAPPHALLDDKEQQHPEAWYARAQDENTNPVEARRLYALIMEEGKKGDAAAQYFLYHMYGSGHGVLRDSSVAYNYLTRSAEKRYFPAQNALARMNEKLALNSSFVASQSSFFNQSKQSSSIKKDPATLYSEGCKHRDTGDFSSAQRCFEEAAKQKSPEACYALAQMYEDEKIWVQNSNDRPLYIQHWYTQAASFGHTDAAYRMGQIHDKKQYRYGNITIDGRVIYFAPVNMNTSHKWYLRAGATHAGAQYKLGLYYEERYNRGSAYSCYQRALAANKGHHAAADALIQLSAEVQVELDSYVSQKDLANKSALWGPSEDDVARVTLAIALRGKLSGQESARMFSKKEVELIFSSDRLNAILNKPQHSWIIDKLRGEWAEEPQAQNAPRMGMSNGR